MTYRPVTLADLARDGKPGREDRRHQRPLSRFFDQEGLKVMAATKLLFDTFHYTVTRRNDGSIEIAPKGESKATRIFHKRAKRHESELEAAHHRDGLDGLDRLCERLLAGWAEMEEST